MNGSGDSPYRSPVSQRGSRPDEKTLARTSVLLVIILAVVTFGLYVPIWFLRRRKAFNALGEEMSVWPFVVVLLLMPLGHFLNPTVATVDLTAPMPGQRLLYVVVALVSGIIILVQSFNAKNILENYTPERDEYGLSIMPKPQLSAVLTFLFTISYLQYKINRMDELELRTPPASSRLLLWGAAAAGFVGLIVVGLVIQSIRGLNLYVEQIRSNLQDNTVITEHIGDIESLEIDWAASGHEGGENVLVFDISGNKGIGRLTAELEETVVSSGTLQMSSGGSYELIPTR